MSESNKEEINNLKRRLETHMEEHRLDEKEYVARQLKQDLAHEKNMEAIDKLTKAVQPLVDGVVVMVALQKVVKWASGFAFLGVIIYMITGHNPFK